MPSPFTAARRDPRGLAALAPLLTRVPPVTLVALVALATPLAAANAQADTVRLGDPRLRAERVVARLDSTDLLITMNGTTQSGPIAVEEVVRTADGLLVVQTNVAPTGAVLTRDSIALDGRTLATRWHAESSPQGSLRLTFDAGRVRGARTPTAGAPVRVDTTATPGSFDYSVSGLVTALLPLREGFAAVIPLWDVNRGTQWMTLRVIGRETLVRTTGTAAQWTPGAASGAASGSPAATRQAWKVEETLGALRLTRWVDAHDGRTLRAEMRQGGATIVASARVAR